MTLPANPDLPLVDCRPAGLYRLGHIAGATSIPSGELFERMHELPQRHTPLQLCGDIESLAEARAFLLERGHTLCHTIEWSENLAHTLASEGRLETGPASRRLWQPSPLLEAFVNDILPHHDNGGRNGIDLACGAGRDMVYMALQGWRMTGMDNSPSALARADGLAQRHGVTITTRLAELEAGTADPILAAVPTDLVMVFRYLHRPLLARLPALVKPGGFIIYQTFMRGCETIGSPRNPRFLLESGELAATFRGFDILQDDIIHLDDGRPLSAFIARHPAR